MTDRELIELAAKAAGYDYECTSHTGRPEHDQHQIRASHGGLVDWNPLTSDADAFRLAVKLGIDVRMPNSAAQVYVAVGEHGHDVYVLEKIGQDPCAATRRAITRAAAEMAKERTS